MNDARNPEIEPAELEVRLAEALAERDLAREVRKRAEEEARRLERELANARADVSAVLARLSERESYVRNLHASSGWKALQALRGLFGRRW